MTIKTYTVWMQGYLTTGMEGYPEPARLIGTAEAESFSDACKTLCSDPQWQIDHGHFDPERLTVWGCRLFDNEADAREFERRYQKQVPS